MRRRDLVPEGIVQQVRGYDRLGRLLVPAIVLGGDGDDVFAVFEDCDLLIRYSPVRSNAPKAKAVACGGSVWIWAGEFFAALSIMRALSAL